MFVYELLESDEVVHLVAFLYGSTPARRARKRALDPLCFLAGSN